MRGRKINLLFVGSAKGGGRDGMFLQRDLLRMGGAELYAVCEICQRRWGINKLLLVLLGKVGEGGGMVCCGYL
jgi:hypothetical protein